MSCEDVLCVSEIGGALGVERMASASIGKIGSRYLINVKIINVRKARVEKRVSSQVRGVEDELVRAIKIAVAKLAGIEAPEQATDSVATLSSGQVVEERRSWEPGALPITLWATGGAGLVTGIVFGVLAKNHEENANDPDHIGAQREIARAETDQLVANISYGVGGACVAAGFLFWLLSDGDSTDPVVAPIAAPGGLGLGMTLTY
jgi:hypothetical protein